MSQTETLFKAAKEGDLETLKTLLSTDLDLNAQDSEGRTALHYACALAQPLIVQWLVDYQAKVDILDNEGYSALHYIMNQYLQPQSPECAKILIQNGADLQGKLGFNKHTLLMLMARTTETELVDHLLKNGFPINAESDLHSTALGVAAGVWGNDIMLQHLLAKGADPNQIQTPHETPLHGAVACLRLNAVKQLLKAGAKVAPKALEGVTPFDKILNQYRHQKAHECKRILRLLLMRGDASGLKQKKYRLWVAESFHLRSPPEILFYCQRRFIFTIPEFMRRMDSIPLHQLNHPLRRVFEQLSINELHPDLQGSFRQRLRVIRALSLLKILNSPVDKLPEQKDLNNRPILFSFKSIPKDVKLLIVSNVFSLSDSDIELISKENMRKTHFKV